MILVLAVLTWVLASVALVVVWIGYRRLWATHSLEEFDGPIQRELSEAITR